MVIYGIITTSNSNDNFINLVVKSSNNTIYNIKTQKETALTLVPNHVYEFQVEVKEVGNRTSYILKEVLDVSFINNEKRDEVLRSFVEHKDVTYKESYDKLFDYINKIKNPILHNITKRLITDNVVDFLTYQGGKTIHHSYLGGLAYHTLGMLKIADSFIDIYPYLNRDYMYAGIILHDLGKIKEYSDVQNPEFALEGHLLGHLVMGAIEVGKVAHEMGYDGSEEVLILEHILVSHHGQLQFGSAKRPVTPEAIMIWYIDTIDSKFEVLKDELEKTPNGTFTNPILVLEKARIYKAKAGDNNV